MADIKIEQVSKIIKGNKVLNRISLELHGGNITGLSGTNGSGKTMLMRLLVGLILPTEGSIWVNGKSLGKEIEFPESIGILIENPGFLDYYSGFQNLKILASIQQKVRDEEIREMMKMTGLNPDDNRKYKKYSLGMKQRLGIAGAALEKPEILILDEPTNALDQDGILMLKELVKKEKERGALIVLSCHDKEILEEMADDIYVLEGGSIKRS